MRKHEKNAPDIMIDDNVRRVNIVRMYIAACLSNISLSPPTTKNFATRPLTQYSAVSSPPRRIILFHAEMQKVAPAMIWRLQLLPRHRRSVSMFNEELNLKF